MSWKYSMLKNNCVSGKISLLNHEQLPWTIIYRSAVEKPVAVTYAPRTIPTEEAINDLWGNSWMQQGNVEQYLQT